MDALPSILEFAHTLAGRGVDAGGVAIDATVGNGHDTLFLAQATGPTGQVIGFDIQEAALTEARRRLRANDAPASVRLVQSGHEAMAQKLGAEAKGHVGAVMFNLGYLPGGDHTVTTSPETTREALEVSKNVLRPGGVITVVAYSGHEGGAEEARAVEAWVSALPHRDFQAVSYSFTNARNAPPRLFAIEKRDDS